MVGFGSFGLIGVSSRRHNSNMQTISNTNGSVNDRCKRETAETTKTDLFGPSSTSVPAAREMPHKNDTATSSLSASIIIMRKEEASELPGWRIEMWKIVY